MRPSELPTLPLRRVENTIHQLLNDMRTVVEARCHIHGTGGGTAATSAAVLLPCIGVELVAERTRSSESKGESIRRVFREIATLTGYAPYGTVGFAVFKLCRNGLAHGFYPNDVQLANGPKAGVAATFWIDADTHRSVCVDEVAGHAESGHLVRRHFGREQVGVSVSAQHLYLDIKAYLEHFLRRLHSDGMFQARVEENERRLLETVTREAAKGLKPQDFAALGLAR